MKLSQLMKEITRVIIDQESIEEKVAELQVENMALTRQNKILEELVAKMRASVPHDLDQQQPSEQNQEPTWPVSATQSDQPQASGSADAAQKRKPGRPKKHASGDVDIPEGRSVKGYNRTPVVKGYQRKALTNNPTIRDGEFVNELVSGRKFYDAARIAYGRMFHEDDKMVNYARGKAAILRDHVEKMRGMNIQDRINYSRKTFVSTNEKEEAAYGKKNRA